MSFSGHKARKRFGQHWLKDEIVLDRIVRAADINSHDRILEVGPGKGALTQRLLDTEAALIHSVELDRDLICGLKKRFLNNSRFSLKEGDVLSTSLVPVDGLSLNKVVANIPYNITGPLLNRLIGGLVNPPEIAYDCLVLLLQKEVAERILAKTGSSSFSAMSVRIQLLASCESVCDVPPRCFKPKPKVESKVLLIKPLNPDFILNNSVSVKLDQLLRIAFAGRRKKLRNTIGSLLRSIPSEENFLKECGISLDNRPQEINPSAWLALAKKMSKPFTKNEYIN